MPEPASGPRNAWAVIVTGVITPEGLPCFLSKDGGLVYPVPLFVHEDKQKAIRRQRSIEARIRSIKFYDGPGMIPAKPILGVVKVTMPPKKAMSQEHKAKLLAARAAAKKPDTVPIAAGQKPAKK